MTDDIVKYLRLSQTRFNRHAEAADEIERLRSQNTELIKMFKQVGVVAEMWQKSEDELIELHHGKCAKQFVKQADEIERLRELLRLFWKESQCIECWADDCEIESDDNLDAYHDPDNCEVAKVQQKYVEMFRDNEYMMAEDDD